MDWAVAGPTRKLPAMATRRRYLKVYSPAGSCSKNRLARLRLRRDQAEGLEF